MDDDGLTIIHLDGSLPCAIYHWIYWMIYDNCMVSVPSMDQNHGHGTSFFCGIVFRLQMVGIGFFMEHGSWVLAGGDRGEGPSGSTCDEARVLKWTRCLVMFTFEPSSRHRLTTPLYHTIYNIIYI